VTAVTYDSPEILRHFAQRKVIRYRLLSDEGSRVIREFGILNDTVKPDSPSYGVPFPGTYVLNEKGVVTGKYFEPDYRERATGGSILVHQFGGANGAGRQEITTRHLKIVTSASNAIAYPGSKVTVVLEVELPAKMHVYAPGVTGYIPVDWTVKENKTYVAAPAQYPASKTLHLKAIQETVPVFEKKVRIARDITVAQTRVLREAGVGDKLKVEGGFKYQACDDKVCYPPQVVPVSWEFDLQALDSSRVPEELRKGSRVQD